MSAGKAIISTNVGGVSYMLRNGQDGIIIPNEDSDMLAKSIIYLYENREEARRLGNNAQKRFYENFTIEKFGDAVLSIVNRHLTHQKI
jgi:glycosyltransferase involved in cell wall biosynthesis